MRTKSPLRLLLSRAISFHPALVDLCEGSITAALFLSQSIYYSEITSAEDGWFWKKSKEWEMETKLSRREQESAREILKRLGFINEELKNSPPIMHYRVDFNLLETAIMNMAETAKLDGGNRQINMAETAKSYKEAEITTETTAEITKLKPSRSKKSSEVDSRYFDFLDLIDKFWKHYNPEIKLLWGKAEGMQLKRLLERIPYLTAEVFKTCLWNRARSPDILHHQAPCEWLPTIYNYAKGPLINGRIPVNGQNSKADRRSADISETTRSVFESARASLRNTSASLPLQIACNGNENLGGDFEGLFFSRVRESDDGIG